MKKFLVTLKDISIYELEVEADDETDAIEMAWERLTEMPEAEKDEAYLDCDGDATAEEIQ